MSSWQVQIIKVRSCSINKYISVVKAYTLNSKSIHNSKNVKISHEQWVTIILTEHNHRMRYNFEKATEC